MKKKYNNFETFIHDLVLENYDMDEETYKEATKMNLVPKNTINNEIYGMFYGKHDFGNIQSILVNENVIYTDLEKGFEETEYTFKIISNRQETEYYTITTMFCPHLTTKESLKEHCEIIEVYPTEIKTTIYKPLWN